MVCFQSLPVELHKTFCDFLDRDDLSSLARTNRCLRALYTPAFKTHLRLDGSEELLRFLAHHLSPSHPEAGASDDDKPATPLGYQASRIFERRPQRVSDQCLDDIRHIVLYEPGVVWRGPQEKRVSELFSRIDRHAISENAGGPIGAILALCPNTVTLSVLQTPLAMMPSLAAAVVANTPRLRALTIHSPHVDADALATVVGGLRHLDKLDVSGVKTCGCRGEEGQRAGVHALAAALRRSRSLRRLVLTACKALSTDNGALLALLAQAPGKGQEGRETGSSLRLSSLEIRRSPVRGPALAALLASPACRQLQHLFVGGCKRVRGRYIRPRQRRSNDGDTASTSSVTDLEVDGGVLSTSLDWSRLASTRRLRVFSPQPGDLAALLLAIRRRSLPNLLDLVILPRPCQMDEWQDGSTSIRSQLVEALRRHSDPGAELQVGDRLWWRVRSEKQEMMASRACPAAGAAGLCEAAIDVKQQG